MVSIVQKRSTAIVALPLCLILLDIGIRLLLPERSGASGVFIEEEFKDLYLPDAYGLLRPHLNVVYPAASNQSSFLISTNSMGMRMREVKVEKSPQTLRIAVMGDSAAFGWGVAEENSFPRLLEKRLNQDGKQKYEVLNFAAPGYTAFHGLKQYTGIVGNFRPDLLILAFGLYDSFETRVSESEWYALLEKYGLIKPLTGFPRLWRNYSAVGHWLTAGKQKAGQEAVENLFQERTTQGIWRNKVTPAEYRTNLSSILEAHRSQGGKAVLVHLDLLNFYVQPSLAELSDQFHVPLLDVRRMFENLGGVEERKKYYELGLKLPAWEENESSSACRLLFRVFVPPSVPVEKTIYIVGNHSKLGNGVPNQVEMYDNGTHGDERAGDRVWSLEITLDQPDPIVFTFTNSGLPKQWSPDFALRDNQGKNFHHFEQVNESSAAQGFSWISQVYVFGKIPYSHLLLPDSPALPNEMGHASLAKRLTRLVYESLGQSNPTRKTE